MKLLLSFIWNFIVLAYMLYSAHYGAKEGGWSGAILSTLSIVAMWLSYRKIEKLLSDTI